MNKRLTEYPEFRTAVKVDVYPDEFKVLLKAINRAIDNKDDLYTKEEVDKLLTFKEDFANDVAEYAI